MIAYIPTELIALVKKATGTDAFMIGVGDSSDKSTYKFSFSDDQDGTLAAQAKSILDDPKYTVPEVPPVPVVPPSVEQLLDALVTEGVVPAAKRAAIADRLKTVRK